MTDTQKQTHAAPICVGWVLTAHAVIALTTQPPKCSLNTK